jgi:V8-like Glu-specific endopeptidase
MTKTFESPVILTLVFGILICNSCSEMVPSGAGENCENICNGSSTVIECDNRAVKPDSIDGTVVEPWNFIGRFDGGSQCSGTLIAGKFVLTAGHCMINQGGQQLGFALSQEVEAAIGRPYGTHGVRRIFVPAQFNDNEIEEQAAYDYAVVELWESIDGGAPAHWGHVESDILIAKPAFTAGYPFNQPDGGFLGRAWITGDNGGQYYADQPFEWVDDEEGGLLYTDLDGTGGQSGSPVYSLLTPSRAGGPDIIRMVSGVLIGSPVDPCEQDQMWVVRLTPAAVQHIENAMDPGLIDSFWNVIDVPDSPTSGPGEAWP